MLAVGFTDFSKNLISFTVMLIKLGSFSSIVHLTVCYLILNNVPDYEATMQFQYRYMVRKNKWHPVTGKENMCMSSYRSP